MHMHTCLHRENFRQGVVALAKKQERSGKNDFEKYMEW